MKSTPLWPGKICAMAVTSLNQASYRLSDPARSAWRMTEVTADGSRLVLATFTPELIMLYSLLSYLGRGFQHVLVIALESGVHLVGCAPLPALSLDRLRLAV